MPVVSESEFQSLPSYLKLMTLQNLNQAIHNINKFTAEYPGKYYKLLMVEYFEGIYISMLCMLYLESWCMDVVTDTSELVTLRTLFYSWNKLDVS